MFREGKKKLGPMTKGGGKMKKAKSMREYNKAEE